MHEEIKKNIRGGAKLCAVVKADAYGHGAEQVALEIEDLVDGFCVAIVEEGVALRVAGVQKPILVLAPPLSKGDAERLKYYDLTATVCDFKSAKLSKGLKIHIAINTGMNRYGCDINGLTKLLKVLSPQQILGVFTLAEGMVKSYAPDALAHLSASGGVALGGKFLFGGVRCGIMLYGYSPCGFEIKGLKPALTVYARLAQRTKFIGGGVGYNLADEEYKRLNTYRLGYGDGFLRGVALGEKTLCMDAFISQKKCELLPVFTDADEYAKLCKTISYEVLCSVTKRSERVYERRIEI